MARSIIGSLWNPAQRNELNRMLEELYNEISTATGTKNRLDAFLNGTGVVTQKMVATGAITNSKLGDNSVDHRTIYPKSIVNSKMADNAIDTIQIRDGAVNSEKISFDSILINKGKLFPLSNHTVSGATHTINEKIKKTILDVEIFGAKKGKVYSLDLILYGYDGAHQVIMSEWESPINGDLNKASKKNIILQNNNDLTFVEGQNEHPNISTVIAKQDGYTAVITFDNNEIGTLVNINHNAQSGGLGLIVHPSCYSYGNQNATSEYDSNTLVVDKKANEVLIYIHSRKNFYTGYLMKRKTIPFEPGRMESNLDLYAIARISTYQRDGDEFSEVPGHAHVYSVSDKVTQDTIFKEVGAADYSGGFFHGDEKIQYLSIVVGNKIMTTQEGRSVANSVELIQHTLLYSDTSTSSTGDTEAFALVKKVHSFDAVKGYTLKSRIEFLKDTTLDMANVGALSMNHTLENSSNPNFTHVVNLDSMETEYLQGNPGDLFSGSNTKEYKFIGWYKEALVTIDSDSEHLETWIRKADSSSKLYTRVVPVNGTAQKGKIINSSVNYRFSVTGVSNG